MKPTVTRCPHCGQRRKRSNPANSRYWLLLHEISRNVKPEGNEYSPEVWHSYMKQRFLGAEEVKMPNKQTMLIPNSSADLSVEEFADYMTRVEEWANGRGVFLDQDGGL
jgi:hypothetical protein